MPNQPWIAPSILSADFARLGEEVKAVLDAGADSVHFDVMDNHYVPNLTIGPLVCEALRKYGITAPIDVHLMVKPVDRIIPDFAAAGATLDQLSSRSERACRSHHRLDSRAGLSPRPRAQSGDAAERARLRARQGRHDSADVGEPGLRRPEVHSFRAHQSSKKVRERIAASGRDIRLQIDGGVKVDNIGEIAAAGADTFVAGSAIFGSKDYRNDDRRDARREIAKAALK